MQTWQLCRYTHRTLLDKKLHNNIELFCYANVARFTDIHTSLRMFGLKSDGISYISS